MTKTINFEGEDYLVDINFTYHALDRMIDRCVSKNRIISCIERGFGYVLDDAEKNLCCKPPIFTALVHSRENFKAVLLSQWNKRQTELNIVIITIVLDLFNPNKNIRKYKHTKFHTV